MDNLLRISGAAGQSPLEPRLTQSQAISRLLCSSVGLWQAPCDHFDAWGSRLRDAGLAGHPVTPP
jgi:hypothetical protein